MHANPVTVFTNIDEIIGYLGRHIARQGSKPSIEDCSTSTPRGGTRIRFSLMPQNEATHHAKVSQNDALNLRYRNDVKARADGALRVLTDRASARCFTAPAPGTRGCTGRDRAAELPPESRSHAVVRRCCTGLPFRGQAMKGSFTFIGNATALITFGDVTVLTDPNFLHAGQYAYLGHGLVSKRLREPAMDIDQLPRVDAVVLSHMHGDHWDRRTQAHLDPAMPIITTEHAANRLQRKGFGAAEGLTTWTSTVVQRGNTTARVTSMPGRHGPTWVQTLHLVPPVMGSMIEFEHTPAAAEQQVTRLRVYISGDTLYVDDLAAIPQRYPSIDTGIFHLGGTTLPFGQSPQRGLMVTMDAAQGVQAMRLIDADVSIPVHYDDYGVFASSLADFDAEARARGIADRVTYVGRGETIAIGNE